VSSFSFEEGGKFVLRYSVKLRAPASEVILFIVLFQLRIFLFFISLLRFDDSR